MIHEGRLSQKTYFAIEDLKSSKWEVYCAGPDIVACFKDGKIINSPDFEKELIKLVDIVETTQRARGLNYYQVAIKSKKKPNDSRTKNN